MKDRMGKILRMLAERSQRPSNSAMQYQINKDYGYVLGMLTVLALVDEHEVNVNEINRILDEIENDYKNL